MNYKSVVRKNNENKNKRGSALRKKYIKERMMGKEMKIINIQNEKRVKSFEIKISLFIFTGVSVLNGKTYIYNYNNNK